MRHEGECVAAALGEQEARDVKSSQMRILRSQDILALSAAEVLLRDE